MALPHAPGASEDMHVSTLLQDLLKPENILLEVNVPSKKRLFEEMGRLFSPQLNLLPEQIRQALEQREALGSTGVGHGVAIPHARLPNISEPAAAYIRPRLPLTFASPDGKPVSDIFVLLVPQGPAQKPLDLLSGIARLFGDRGFRERLNQREDPMEVYRLINEALRR